MIKVFLDNVEISDRVEVDLSFVEKLDMELDEGFLVISHSTRETPYNMFSTIDIYENNNIIFTGKISQDNVSLSSFSDELYNHKITIIEHTKILEKFLVTGKSFTQPTDDTTVNFYTLYDVVESLRKTTNLNLVGNEEINTPFNIPLAVKEELEVIIAPEFSFKDVTLRQALDEVFFYIDSIVRLDRNKNIIIEKFNQLNEEIDFLTENYKRDQNIIDYSTMMSSDLSNAVNTDLGFAKYNYEYYPGKDLWTTLRSTSLTQFDFESSFIPTSKPIYDVQELLTVIDIRIVKSDQAEPEGATVQDLFDNDFFPLDIGYYVVEKNIYNTLPERIPTDYEDLTKRNVLLYEYGRKGIQVGETFGVFDIATVFPFLRNSASAKFAFDNNYIPEGATEFPPPAGFNVGYFKDGFYYWINSSFLGNVDSTFTFSRWEGLFRVKYTPILPSIRYEVARDDVSEVFVNSKSISNQKLRIIDLERFTNNMKGRINQLGESQLILSHKVKNISQTYNIGDFNEDKFIITKKEVIVQRDHYIVNYELNKNFNKMSQFMGIDQEIRQYEIGEDGRSLERDLNYNEYIEVYADNAGVNTSSSNTLIQPSILLNTVNPSYAGQNFAKYSVFTSPDLVNEDNNQIPITLPVYRVSGGGAFGFYFDFESNNSAGDRLVVGGDGFLEQLRRFNIPLKYTNEIGRLESILVSVHDGALLPEDNFNDEIDVATALPEFTKQFSNQFLSGSFYIEKDNRETLKLTILYHLLSKDLSEVVIGELFSTNNAFFIESSNSVQLRMWNNRTFLTRDKNRILDDEDLKITNPTITFDYTNNYFQVPDDVESYSSWALTDSQGYPYIMVNSTKRRIVFDFRTQRTGVDYGGAAPAANLLSPTSITSSATTNSVTFVIGNPNTEDADLEVTLGQDVETFEVLAGSQSPNVTFSNLDPNTNYTVSAKLLPKSSSVLLESQPSIFSRRTNIIPINPPTYVEKNVVQSGGDTFAIYTMTNPNNLDGQVFVRIDGFETSTTTIPANQTVDITVGLIAPQQTIEQDVTYDIDFRFRTTEFTNNWFSPYTVLDTLFIGVLDDPNYGTALTTDTTAQVSWGNPNNVATQIEVQLTAAPFTSEGGQTLVATQTVNIGAQGGATVTFTGLDDDTFFSSRAKLLTSGFSLESGSVNSPSFKTDISRTSTPTILNVQTTTTTITFDLRNNDDEIVDIYWNTTGNPNETDNVLTNIGTTAPNNIGSDSITGLSQGQLVTIYFTAKSSNKAISLVGQSTTQTFRQLSNPVYGFAFVTSNSISTNWGNSNDTTVTMEAKLKIGGTVIDTQLKTIQANGNLDNDRLIFTGLSSNTNYNIDAKFLESGINLESGITNSGTITTSTLATPSPSISNISTTSSSVTFTLTNNDDFTSQLGWGLSTPVNNFENVNSNSSITRTLSNLQPSTSYLLKANAETSGKTISSTVESPFTTQQQASPTQWVFRSATTPNETLARGFVSGSCPTSGSNLTYLNGQIDPSTKTIGYVVAVTSSSESGGFPIECTTHYFEAQ